MILEKNINKNIRLSNCEENLDFYIKEISISGFRNHQNVNLALNKDPVILHGSNGTGKTNILEAISFLNPGRGLRKAKSKDIISIKKNSTNNINYNWGVNANIITPRGLFNIGSGSNEIKKNRTVKINSDDCSQTSLSKIVKISWITPQMLLMFHSNMNEKRRFIDRLVNYIDPSHVSNIYKYEKFSRERSKIINNFNSEDLWIETVEKKIADLALLIIKKRNQLILELNKIHYQQLSNSTNNLVYPSLELSIEGEIEDLYAKIGEIEAKKSLFLFLKKNRNNNISSFPGPHNSSVIVLNKKNKKEITFCSTGEQKIMLISLVLSHSRLLDIFYNFPPILLLDDIIEHLDYSHKKSLFEETAKHKSQCWFTTTDINYFNEYPKPFNEISMESLKDEFNFEREFIHA